MMEIPKPVVISVPGTSANLGPGFDILGMSWKIYNEFSFRFDGEGHSVSMRDLSPLPFDVSEDLVYESYKRYFEIFLPNFSPPEYQCRMRLNLPMKGGLGSSASAVVAGFVLAKEVHRQICPSVALPSESRFLYELAMIEGHPDNTSPAYLGGYILSYFDGEGHLKYYKKRFPSSVSCFLLCPKREISTQESRLSLPSKYTIEDIIFNMARIATWMKFFETRKFGDLLLALQDRIHTPYRLSEMHYMKDVANLIQRKQMGFCLSGSGPAILIYVPRKRVSQIWSSFQNEISAIFRDHKIDYELTEVKPDNNGCIIKRW